MQKVSVGFDRSKEMEELKKEVSTLQKTFEKAEWDNAYHAQRWREARMENDKLKEEKEADQREIEDLRHQLDAANIRAATEYDKGVEVAT